MSWVALDSASSIADLLHKQHYTEMWKTEADKIKADIFEKGWKEDIQSFPQAYSHLAFINAATLFSEEQVLSKFIRP